MTALAVGLNDYVAALVARLEAAFPFVAVYPYPPPSLTTSAILVLPGDPFIGQRLSPCVYPVSTVIRYASAVLEQAGAYADVYAAIDRLQPLFPNGVVTVGARRWSLETYVCADIAQTDTLSLPPA